MLIGLNLPNYGRLGNRDSVVAIAEAAEALGYASLWTNDHVLLPTSRREPFGNVLESLTTLSYIAARTSRIRNRGHLADEYIAAMRELFESDTPEFHGPHINYADVLFVPRPTPRIPILVGGDSPAALKRAASLGDGWYGLWRSPVQVRESIAQIDAFGRPPQFEVSVRVLTRVGGLLPDSDPETTLQGDADGILHIIQAYGDAGVDRLVIEPVSRDLDDFRRPLARFAEDITLHIARTSA